MNNTIVFIVNPIAGKGLGKVISQEIEEYFLGKDVSITVHFTQKANHATLLAKDFVKQNPLAIVACGGDGTINEVAQALVGTSIALGVIPIGSGNGLASNLRIPSRVHRALDIVCNQHSTFIDVGKLNDSYFFSNIGMGIDADVIHRYAQGGTRNFYGYLKASLKSVYSYSAKSFKVQIDQNSEFKDSFYFLFCSNSNQAGYGISFSPQAQLNDGKLDFLAIKKLNLLEQLYFSFCVLTHRINRMKKARVLQAKEIEFLADSPGITLQIDGEDAKIETKGIKVKVLEKSLKVLVP
ncbi:diacylglycerol/lipid kinase family protein [Myroides sp. LJL115]